MKEKIKSLLKSRLYADVVIACHLLVNYIPTEEGYEIIRETKLSKDWEGTPDNLYHYMWYGEFCIQISPKGRGSIWISTYKPSSNDVPI